MNIDGGCTLTNAPERLRADDRSGNLVVAKTADKAGFEVLLPVGRWRGYGGDSNPMEVTYETYPVGITGADRDGEKKGSRLAHRQAAS